MKPLQLSSVAPEHTEPSGSHPAGEPAAQVISCIVTAHASVSAAIESIAAMRRQPGPVYRQPLSAAFLKHADEQTVAGLAAVFQAIERHGLGAVDFRDWGVLAAPRFLGRLAQAAAIHRFAQEGAWGISPHLIPHRTLHSVSGTVSQALAIHGPNFGVGGGPEGVSQVLMAAGAMLRCRSVPGVWVVLTGMEPEPSSDRTGRLAGSTDCLGIALALEPAMGTRAGLRLQLVPHRPADLPPQPPDSAPGLDLLRLDQMLRLVTSQPHASASVWLNSAMQLELAQGQGPAATHGVTPAEGERKAIHGNDLRKTRDTESGR